VFVSRPISLALLVLAAAAIIVAALPAIRRKHEVVFAEDA
jgi:putative tricarboxylic transport membrane protein